MGFQHILISDGEYLMGTHPYWYPVSCPDISDIAHFNYRGNAWVENNHIGIELSSTQVAHLEILPMTEKQQAYCAGWEHALTQKIRREPKDTREGYWHGWYDCWKERKACA